MEGLVEGRIIHYVLQEGETQSTRICRPAIIVNAWNGMLEDGKVNLQIFLDGKNDANIITKLLNNGMIQIEPHTIWLTSIKYSKDKETNSWHWPERN